MTTIRVCDEDAEAIERKAYEIGTEPDEIVKELVEKYLEYID